MTSDGLFVYNYMIQSRIYYGNDILLLTSILKLLQQACEYHNIRLKVKGEIDLWTI